MRALTVYIKKVHFAYAWVYEEKPADDVAAKEQSDDFMRHF